MARQINRLTALAVGRATRKGLYADGGGLYLQVGPTGAKSWLYRYMLDGKARAMGLGPLHTVTLAEARQKALECRKIRLEGTHPIDARRAARAAARVSTRACPTFEQAAEAYIAAQEAGWRSPKQGSQWRSSLNAYAYPVLGGLPISAVELGDVMQVLDPIWRTKPETASRVRGRMESVLDWARVHGHRSGENPARWRGHLQNLLPARAKVRRVEHFAALPHRDIAAFMTKLSTFDGVSAMALRFLILTTTRTAETIGARWDEFDLDNAVWTIPPDRMKAGRLHRVPLAPTAVVLLSQLHEQRTGLFVFAGGRAGRPLSNMSLLALLRRMKRADVTAHGFRSTFRDWAAEMTDFPREVAEQALAHSIGDKVEAAYRRGDLFDRRRLMMEQWDMYCHLPPAQ